MGCQLHELKIIYGSDLVAADNEGCGRHGSCHPLMERSIAQVQFQLAEIGIKVRVDKLYVVLYHSFVALIASFTYFSGNTDMGISMGNVRNSLSPKK